VRRRRRPKPSEIRPGDEYMAKLMKKMRKGARRSFPVVATRGFPAAPLAPPVEDDEGPLPAAPMPRIPIPGLLPTHERPPSRKVEASHVEKLTAPGSTTLPPEHGLKPAAPPLVHLPGGNQTTTESEPQTITEPVCPLLGAPCASEWCRWWDQLTGECLLVSLNTNLSVTHGKLQALTDYLHYRLGGD